MANDKDPVFCAADIIKRAKLAKEFKTDSELAAFLGISRSTLSLSLIHISEPTRPY